jgi:hypothetical protein
MRLAAGDLRKGLDALREQRPQPSHTNTASTFACHAAVDSAVDSTSTPAFARRRNRTAMQRLNVQIDERIAALPSLRKITKQRSASPSSDAASTWICGNIPPRQTRTDSVPTVRADSISDSRCGRIAAGRRSSTTCRPRRRPSATKTNVTPGSCRSPKSRQSRPATPSRRPWQRTVPCRHGAHVQPTEPHHHPGRSIRLPPGKRRPPACTSGRRAACRRR